MMMIILFKDLDDLDNTQMPILAKGHEYKQSMKKQFEKVYEEIICLCMLIKPVIISSGKVQEFRLKLTKVLAKSALNNFYSQVEIVMAKNLMLYLEASFNLIIKLRLNSCLPMILLAFTLISLH